MLGRTGLVSLLSFALSVPVSAQSFSNLDLSSPQHSVTAASSGQIKEGSAIHSVAVNDLLTPAESVALYQATTGGAQQIILNGNGAAIGGTLTVGQAINPKTNFVIPSGVTVVQTLPALNLTGNLTNSGTLYAASSSVSAAINAANIFNRQGALITTALPASFGITSAVPVSLSLTALYDVINAGSIVSANNLSVTAGGSIVNALPAGVTGARPIMQAVNNISFTAGTGSQLGTLVNSGLINSIAGNINITSALQNNILINNVAGQIMAQMGSIDLRDSLFTGKCDTALQGGDFLAQTLKIWSGTGNVLVDVNELSGPLNITAGTAQVISRSDTLHLGSMTLTGDPTFFNATGSISIDSPIVTGGTALAILANKDVTSTGAGSINTTGGASAGSVFIMSGVNLSVTPASTGSSDTAGQNGGNGDSSSAVLVKGPSTTGGMISLSSLTLFNAQGNTGIAGASGGDVTLVAFAGTGTKSGTINAAVNSVNGIQTGGGSTGSRNGNVIMIAGATSDPVGSTAIVTGTINTGAGTTPYDKTPLAQGGEIVLITATPITSGYFGFYKGAMPPVLPLANAPSSGANVAIDLSYPQPGVAPPAPGLCCYDTSLFASGQTIILTGSTNASSLNIQQEAQTIQSVQPGVSITLGQVNNNYVFCCPPIPPGAVQYVTIQPVPQLSIGALQPTSITTSSLTTNSAPVTMVAGSNINLSGTITTGGTPLPNLTIGATGPGGILSAFAGGNITNSAGLAINTAGSQASAQAVTPTSNPDNNNGGNVLLIAGAQLTTTFSKLFQNALATPTSLNFSVQVNGPSSTGGNVNLSANPVTSFSTAAYPTPAAGSEQGYAGGTVHMVAFANGAGTGQVTLPSTLTIFTGGTSAAVSATPPAPILPANYVALPSKLYPNQNGDVMIIAGATSGTGLNIGNINTTGSNAGSGNITIVTATPTGVPYSLAYTDGAVASALTVSGAFSPGAIQPASAVVGNLTAAGGSMYVSDSYLVYTTAINVTAGGALNIGSVQNTNNVLPQGFTPYAVSPGNTPPIWPPLFFLPLDSSSINLTAGSTMTFVGAPTISSNAAAVTQQPNPATSGYIGAAGTNGGTVTLSAATYVGAVTVTADGTGGRYLAPNASPIPAAPLPPPAPVPVYPPQPTPTGATTYTPGSATDGFFPITMSNGGNGGSISITSTSAASGSINVVGAGGFTISAKGDANSTVPAGYDGGGDGGKVTINSAANVTIAPGSFRVAPQAGTNTLPTLNTINFPNPPLNNMVQIPTGNGAVISLTGQNVYVSGAFDVSGAPSTLLNATTGYPGGNGGSVSIITNSSTPFNIGVTGDNGVNGVKGNLTAIGSAIDPGTPGAIAGYGSGGTVYVENRNTSGGIVVQSGALSVAAADATMTAGAIPSPVTGGFPAPPSGFAAGVGGAITLIGSTVLTMSGLDASGGGASPQTGTAEPTAQHTSGSGGSISIVTNSTTPFTLGTPTTNGVTGSLTANGNIVGQTAATGGSAQNFIPTGVGGAISLTNLGGGIIANGPTTISVAAAAANTTLVSNGGAGGSISISGNGQILIPFALSADGGAATAGQPNGGSGGAVTVSSTSSSAPQLFIGAAGPPGSSELLSLSAQGYSGGSISVTNNGAGGIGVAAGSVLVTANSQPSATSAGGNGGNITLQAPNGPLFINGGLDVSGASGSNFGGSAGSITLASNSPTSFLIDTATGPGGNGVGGILSANGGTGTAGNGDAGTISVTNSGGGITVTAACLSITAPAASAAAYAGGGGNIFLTAPTGAVSITGALHADGGAVSIGTHSAGMAGSISITTSSPSGFAIGGGSPLTQLTANGWNGGMISITNASSGGITVDNNSLLITASAADPTVPSGILLNYGVRSGPGFGGTITLTSPGTVTPGNLSASGGALFQQLAAAALPANTTSITLTSVQGFAPGQQITVSDGATSENITIAAGGVNTATNTITLSGTGLTKSYATAPTISAYSLSQPVSSVVVLNGSGNPGSGGPFNYANANQLQLTLPDAQGFIFLQSVNIVQATPAYSEYQTVSQPVNVPAGLVTVTGATTAYDGSSTGLTINAFTNNGTITINGRSVSQSQAPGTTSVLRAGTINLNTTGAIGSSGAPLQIETLVGATAGTLTTAAGGGAFINNISNSLNLGNTQTGSDFSLTSNGHITTGSLITAGGAFTVFNTNTNLGNTAGSTLTLRNDNLLGQINVADGLNFVGTDVIFTNGPPPITPVPGVTPPNVTVVTVPPFQVFFGANGITATGPLTLYALTGNVIFNASGAGLINFGTGGSVTSFRPAAPPTALTPPPPIHPLSFNLGSFSSIFGTIISTDQTPEAIPGESAGLGSSKNSNNTTNQQVLFGKVKFIDQRSDLSIVTLPPGNSLFYANADSKIITAFGEITVKSGSALLILQNDNGLAVLNLHDDRRNAVTFDMNGSRIEIPLGRQLIISSRWDLSFDQINPSRIGYRELSEITVGGRKVYLSEFSIISALSTIGNSLTTANVNPERILKRLLKSAAANFLLRQGQGKPPFKAVH